MIRSISWFFLLTFQRSLVDITENGVGAMVHVFFAIVQSSFDFLVFMFTGILKKDISHCQIFIQYLIL